VTSEKSRLVSERSFIFSLIFLPDLVLLFIINKKKNHKEKKEIPASFALLVLPMQQK
jgi:hypothetical protein